MSMVTFWGIAMVVFLVIEGITFGIASIWFAIGALAALISAVFKAAIWLQIVWFVVVSGITLYFTRPLVKNYVHARRQPTNADRVLGTVAVVVETIDNLSSLGAVKAGGKLWTARSADDSIIRKDEKVEVKAIEGVKLIVSLLPLEKTEEVPAEPAAQEPATVQEQNVTESERTD